MKNILITGGAGFIGCHLVRKLLENGNRVICIDNFTLGSVENIKEFYQNPNFIFHELDIVDTQMLLSALENEQIDTVYHLAANSDIQKGGVNPSIDLHNTFMTTVSVLEIMRLKGIKNFFFASTSAVYGNITDKLLSEDMGGLKPISYYGGAKLASESFISSYTYMNEINTVIFRFPNVIGPNLTHGVIYDFVKRLSENPKELKILGDGTQQKPYIFVDDLVDVILKMTEVIPSGMEIYNVGVNGETSVTNIANIICQELGLKDVVYQYTGGNIGWKGDVPKFQYDLSKIHSKGWNAKFNSDESVRETVKYVKGIVK